MSKTKSDSAPSLRTLLDRDGRTIAEVAAAAGCSAGSVYEWLRGRLPQGGSVNRLATALNVTVEVLRAACRRSAKEARR